MHIVAVSENTLFGELLGRVGADSGFEVAEIVKTLDLVSESADQLLVILHVGANATLAGLGLSGFSARMPSARVIVIADPGVSSELLNALEESVEAILFENTSARTFVSLLTIAGEGFQIRSPPIISPPGPDNVSPNGARAVENDAPVDTPLSDNIQTEVLSVPSGDGSDLKTSRLSGRELEILQLLVNGSSNKEIANHLQIVENTVKVHLRSCYGKIGVRNRTQAALWGVRNFAHLDPKAGSPPSRND